MMIVDLFLVLALVAPEPQSAQEPQPAQPGDVPASEWQMVDRVVSVVDEVPILLSDIRRLIELGLVMPEDGESRRSLERRALDRLIDQRVRLQEVDRGADSEVDFDEIDLQVAALQERLGGPAALDSRLSRVGMNRAGLESLLGVQLRVMRFVEERLRPRVLVRLEEVRAYYEEELSPRLAEQGQEVPPLAEIQEEIRALLRERDLNREIDAWTLELRLEADIYDYLDAP